MDIRPFHNEILDKKFTHQYRTGYVKIDGFVFPKKFSTIINDVLDLEVNDSDIWVTSYPKTGTTWTQEMVWLIANDLDFETALNKELDERFPFVEFVGMFEIENEDEGTPEYVKNSIKAVKQMKKPRFIKSHLPWNLLPKQIQNGSRNPKIIHVVRNPKDTCVSYFHHMRLLEGFRGSFEEFCELFLADEVNFSPFWKNIGSYWEHRHQNNLLFLRYEDMKRDLPSVVKKVSKFFGKSYGDDQIRQLCDHLSFESMKKNPAVNKDVVVQNLKRLEINIAGDHFIRSGKVGDFKTLMNEDLVKRFDVWAKENMKDMRELFYGDDF